eukprot:g8267.t1
MRHNGIARQQLLDALVKRFRELSPHEVQRVCSLLARVGGVGGSGGDFIARDFFTSAFRHCDAYPDYALCNVLNAAVRAGVEVDRHLLTVMGRKLNFSGMSVTDLSVLVYALSRLCPLLSSSENASERVEKIVGQLMTRSAEAILARGEGCAADEPRSIPVESAGILLNSFAQYYSSSQFSVRASATRSSSPSPGTPAGDLRHQHLQPLFDHISNQILLASVDSLAHRPSVLSLTMNAYAKLNIENFKLMQVLAELIAGEASILRNSTLVNLVQASHALARFDVYHAGFLNAVEARVSAALEGGSRLGSKEIANLAWAYARLRSGSADFFENLFATFAKIDVGEKWDPQSVAQILDAMSRRSSAGRRGEAVDEGGTTTDFAAVELLARLGDFVEENIRDFNTIAALQAVTALLVLESSGGAERRLRTSTMEVVLCRFFAEEGAAQGTNKMHWMRFNLAQLYKKNYLEKEQHQDISSEAKNVLENILCSTGSGYNYDEAEGEGYSISENL